MTVLQNTLVWTFLCCALAKPVCACCVLLRHPKRALAALRTKASDREIDDMNDYTF
jgi:hypothetical protein